MFSLWTAVAVGFCLVLSVSANNVTCTLDTTSCAAYGQACTQNCAVNTICSSGTCKTYEEALQSNIACNTSAQCQQQLGLRNVFCNNQVCDALMFFGDVCGSNSDCLSNNCSNFACTGPDVGANCTDDLGCPFSAYCDLSAGMNGLGLCTNRIQYGQKCVDSFECWMNSVCFNNSCVETQTVGVWGACQVTNPSPLCVPGSICAPDTNGHEVCTLISDPLQLTRSCSSDSDCDSVLPHAGAECICQNSTGITFCTFAIQTCDQQLRDLNLCAFMRGCSSYFLVQPLDDLMDDNYCVKYFCATELALYDHCTCGWMDPNPSSATCFYSGNLHCGIVWLWWYTLLCIIGGILLLTFICVCAIWLSRRKKTDYVAI